MATKKAASNAKKSTVKKSVAKKQETTKITTVKAVESRPALQAKTISKGSVRFSLSRTPFVAALIAEFIGTFIFAGAAVAGQGQPLYVLFALVGVILAISTLSGGYVNPALTLGAWVTRRMSGLRAAGYIVAQLLGAMLAFVVLNAFVHAAPTAATDALSSTSGAATSLFKAAALPAGKEWFVFFCEFIGTVIFGFAVAGATREKKDRTAAALTVGLGLFLGLMIAGSSAALLGTSSVLNPAVAITMQAINFNSVWPIMVYVVGAGLGGIVGFILFDLLRGAEKEEQTV